MKYQKIKAALQALQEGKLVLVMDDKERENEGDLICSAQSATTENVNFMATYAKGLICMPMSESLANQLMLSPMVENNTDNHETAFTVSIDYKDTTTGISAEERGLTARMCVVENINPFDFRRPGHMFPLIAKNGGVLERNGHTEATVDLLRLAGLKECGLCCEIMNENGKMMRTPDLIQFSQTHHIPTLTIKELQEYRKVYDILVECVSIVEMPTKYGKFKAHCYINKLNGEHHIALVMGNLDNGNDVLCRVHSECLTGDVFGSLRCDCGQQLDKAMKMIAEEIEEIFDKEVSTIYLNFSDPWPKKRHIKRRLSSDNFLKKYDGLFKSEKRIIMKTDNRKLFEYSIKSFTDYGYKIEELSLDLYNDDIIDNVQTEYESKFVSLGQRIYMIKVYKEV